MKHIFWASTMTVGWFVGCALSPIVGIADEPNYALAFGAGIAFFTDAFLMPPRKQ